MEWVLYSSLTFFPLAGIALSYWFGRPRWWGLLGLAMIGGSLPGAFIGAAASAMASAVSTQTGLLRGAFFGALVGFTVGGVFLTIRAGVRRFWEQKK